MSEEHEQEAPAEETGGVLVAMPAQEIERHAAEIKSLVEIAHRYPRQLLDTRERPGVLSAIEQLVTMDPETAEKCYYSLPGRKNNKTGKVGDPIEGASIRMLEIAANQWGNLQYAVRPVEINRGERWVSAHAYVVDHEKNSRVDEIVRRRIMFPGDDGVQIATAQALSVALRNALGRMIPKSYLNKFVAVAKSYVAKNSDTDAQRKKIVDYFESMNIPLDRVLELVDVASVKDLKGPHIATLRGLATSIREGFISAEKVASGELANELREREVGEVTPDDLKPGEPPAAKDAPGRPDDEGPDPTFDATKASLLDEINGLVADIPETEFDKLVAKAAGHRVIPLGQQFQTFFDAGQLKALRDGMAAWHKRQEKKTAKANAPMATEPEQADLPTEG